MRGALIVILSCLGATAVAQPLAPGGRLLFSEGVLRGSPRLIGIAGAFVGVGEGAEGAIRNPAAAASKDPRFPSEPEPDFGFALHFLPPWAVRDQDWDNDGRLDARPGPQSFLGTQVVYGVGSLQHRALGVAGGFDVQNHITRGPTGGHNLSLLHLFGTVAVSLREDSLLLGAGVESTQGILAYFAERTLQDTLYYGGVGLTFGALWRPRDRDYRIGLAVRSGAVAPAVRPREEVGGLVPPDEVVAPPRVSVGASWAVGAGRAYNITSRAGWVPLPGRDEPSPVMTKLLVTAQLDVALPVSGATPVDGFLRQESEAPPAAGHQPTVTPRLAVEKEALPDELRLRGGGYLEPTRVSSGRLRPHATFGFEVFMFRLFRQRIGFGLSFDLAREYQNLSVALLEWK